MSETGNDREIDAAWRAASREEPPAALDAAIRAEARRAVGAAPGDVRRRRRRQLRYPFAAAATVALLAFGISQMIPPDQDAMIVADQTAAPRQAPLSRSAPAPREPTNAAAPVPQSSTNATAPAPRQESAAPSSSASNAPAASQPFPAGAGGEAPKALAEKVPAPASLPAMEARRDRAPVDAMAQAQEPQQTAPPAVATTAEKRRASSPQALGQSSSLDDTRAKQAGAGSVDAWIARIRALKASGDLPGAARELAAFRDTYGDRADALLPRDLRGVTAADNKAQ